jgi:hypothetical protein
MYHHRYELAKRIYSENIYKILLTDDLPYNYKNITRWYDPQSIQSNDETLLSQGMKYFFMENYDLALFKFHDLLANATDYKMQLLLSIKIVVCLSLTDKKEALALLQPILKCSDAEICTYATKQFEKINEDKIAHATTSKKTIFDIQSYSAKFDEQLFV